jgi:hypothetical protein
LLISWLIFPLVLAALALGLGLLLERLAGIRLPGALVLPVGFASLVVIAGFATLTGATAELATPLAVVLAVLGLALTTRRRNPTLDPWALVCTVGVFAVFAAPVVLSGEATFAGYAKLDDTAAWFGVTDRVMEHGRSLTGLAPSSYHAVLDEYIGTGYPVGAFVPLGVGRELVGQDIAWIFQPYLAFIAAMLALSLYAIAARFTERRWAAALLAFVGGQAALLFGYSLWGGVKEVAAAAILALVAATAPFAAEPGTDGAASAGTRGGGGGGGGAPVDAPRRLVPFAMAGGAMLGILSLGGIVWLLPPAAGLVVVALRRRGSAFALRHAGWFGLLAAAFAFPAIVANNAFIEPARSALTSQQELGKLYHSLSPLQIFGVWPTGDFRRSPDALGITDAIVALAAGGGVISIVWAWRRRAFELLAYIASATIGCIVVTALGSPWVDGKAFAIVSPAFAFAGLCGAWGLLSGRRRPLAALAAIAGVAIAVGVVWSNVLAYHGVNLAPRDRLAELAKIGNEIKGQGPTLLVEYEPYATRHFLRDALPEAPLDVHEREINFLALPIGSLYLDIDGIQAASVLPFRTIVLPRSPIMSRPPAPYQLVRRSRFYEIWRRSARLEAPIVAQLPLRGPLTPASVPQCGEILKIAGFVGGAGQLVAARAETPTFALLSKSARPPAWRGVVQHPTQAIPTGSGKLETSIDLSRPGRYDVWLGGTLRGGLVVSVDGHSLWSGRHVLTRPVGFIPLGQAALRAGKHSVTLSYDASNAYPGSGGRASPLGPFALTPANPAHPLTYVPARRARELCGDSFDWVEATSSSPPLSGQAHRR